MYDDDTERFRSIDGFLKNTIAEKNAQDKAIIREVEEFKVAQARRQSAAFQKRQRWAAEHRQKEKEKPQGPSLLERSAANKKHMAKYEADIKLWRQKWYVKVLAPFGLASFLNPPKFGE